MNIKVKDYLEDLSKVDVPREDGIILLDESFVKDDDLSGVFLKGNIHYTTIGDKSYYFTTISPTRNVDNVCINTEIINSQVYNDLGVNCADYYPMVFSSLVNNIRVNNDGVICQDLLSLDEIEVCQVTQSSMYYDHSLHRVIANKVNGGYWVFLELKEILVDNYITEECFDEMVNMYLLDVVATQRDRNPSNFFLYRKKGSQLWEGIIAIDNSYTIQNDCLTIRRVDNCNAKRLAELIWQDPNGLMLTFPRTYNMQPYGDRLKEINNLIQSGEFNKKQIDLIKSIKDYDLSGTIKKVEDDKHLTISSTQKDVMNYLWERTQSVLEV